MIEFRNILCPVDFFPVSRRAFDYAVGMAAHYGAGVHALHVVAPLMAAAYVESFGAPELTEEFEKQSRRLLDDVKASAGKSGVTVDTEVRVGNIDSEILQSIEKAKADLVVMGTHGLRSIQRLVLGSVTERMIRHCPVPLMIIGPGRKRATWPLLLRRILVTTDFSQGTADAVHYALSIAQECQAKVTLLHVVHDIAADTSGRYRSTLIRGVKEDLEKMVPASARDWCDIETRVETGHPARVIPSLIKSGKTDLLVMNIHGKNFLERALIGSTAEKTVRTAAYMCPVLLIPPSKSTRAAKKPRRK